MQTVEFVYPPDKRRIQWIEDATGGRGSVEVALQLTLQRHDEWEHWQIVAATVADLVPYVMGSKHGIRCVVDDDVPDAWLDWCRTPEFLEMHGADIEKAACEQWLREMVEA